MLIFYLHIVATCYMVGVIWFVQWVHYPLLKLVDPDHYEEYERRHQRAISFVIGPAMIVEGLTGLFLAMEPTAPLSHYWTLAGLFLIAMNWLSTAYLQAPLHSRLANGHDPLVIDRLVATNWVRTVCWSLRLVWCLVSLFYVLSA